MITASAPASSANLGPGFDVAALYCLVDRCEGGRAAIEAEGVTVTAVFERPDFFARAEP